MMKKRVTAFLIIIGFLIIPFLVLKASQEQNATLTPAKLNTAEKISDVAIEQKFVVVVPSYNNEEFYRRNLDSIFSQEYNNFHVIYIEDASTDNTLSCVQQYIEEKHVQKQITLVHNEKNRKAMYNLYTAIHSCPSDAVVVIVDGDDWLYHPYVLKELNQVYANNDVWMTYGQYMRYPDNQIGCCAPVTKDFLRDAKARQGKWQYTHLRTFYAGLFQRIPVSDFVTEGKFFDATYDLAIMFPMLEMARDHAYFIPDVNYVYNYSTPLNDAKMRLKEQERLERIIRAKPVYSRLLEHPKNSILEESSDLIVFSYNRPLQLYAFLESLEKRVVGLNKVSVLFRADDYFTSGYQIVQEAFPHVQFVQQSKSEPRKDFKPLVMEMSFGSRSSDAAYILYAVDDIVITEDIDVRKDVEKLKKIGAYGFYYRLGEGVDYCYSEDKEQTVPRLIELEKDVYMWEFSQGTGDWGYPNSVDFVLYAKKELQPVFEKLTFSYPNDFEGNWARLANPQKLGLCHRETKMVNIPLNLVTSIPNRHLNAYSPHALNEMFLAGLKMDVDALWKVKHNSAHANVAIQFVPRVADLFQEASVAAGD